MRLHVGIDTGGTFTDLVAFDAETGALRALKTSSTPDVPGRAIVTALAEAGIPGGDVDGFTHGTTVGTNALIERTGCKVAFLTTKGFEDTPYIQRINRKVLYDLQWKKPDPLVATRRLCLGIDARLGADGETLRPIDEDEVRLLCRRIAAEGAEAVAVCLLFSYVNTEHEEQVKRIVAGELGDVPVSISHEVAPIWREYERASTTIADAYLKPLFGRYVSSLDEELRTAGMTRSWTIMKSNGGAMQSSAAADSPIQTVMSGPAGGMIASQAFAEALGVADVLTLDMGGTSADVGIIVDGAQRHTTEYEIEWGLPAAVPLIDIKSIGAGGGSIAWVDAGGFLRVGPRSAGAQPGPACYGHGGEEPTVTDANLLLGRLDPDYFLGGRMQLDHSLAEAAMDALARRLGMGRLDLAASIVEIANENMASAIKMVSLERGHDPRRFALLAFGGAGPLHACAIARSMGIPTVVVPPLPGTFSALGLLLADIRVDKVWTQAFRSTDVDGDLVSRQFDRITERALEELRQEGFVGEPEIRRAINMRYFGQNYEHAVEIAPGPIGEEGLRDAFRRFDKLHEARYGYLIEGETIELVSFKVTAVGRRPVLDLSKSAAVERRERTIRDVYFRDSGFVEATIVHREALEPAEVVAGPAIIEEEGSTTLVERGMQAERTAQGSLIITTGDEAMKVPSAIDQVTLTVIDNYCTSTCRDMGVTMMTTSYSPIFNESLDFSCVIFDPQGQMLAQAEFCPSQIGTIKFTVTWTIAELGIEAFEEGDVVLHNDPYRGSGHVPEHMLLKPVFWEGKLVAFVANVAHMSEIGAKTPGGLSGDATEIFQEGLLLPPVKIKRRGEDVEDVWKIVLTNHRTPRVTYGDFRAMMGSLDLGEQRLHKLIGDYGLEVFQAATAELVDIAERRMRAEVAQIPDGTYFFEDAIEDDGISEGSYSMKLRLTIDGDEVIADFTGSAPQAVGPVNAIYAVTASAVYNAFLHLTDPSIPRNEGCYRPFTIIAPPGTIVNCSFPAPVAGGNTETSPRLTDMIFGALADAIPDKVVASCGGTSSPFLFGGRDPRTGDLYAHFHFEGVGWGGRVGQDGNNMVVTINGNCRNTPVEVFETRYPAFRVESYRLETDSGGPGRFRGGLGGDRVFTVTVPEVTVSALLNRMKTKPWGVLGGREGAVGGLWVRRAGQEEWRTFVEEFGTMSPSKFSGVTLHAGDQVRIRMPGGGGYGDPLERDRDLVRRDVREGFVSSEAARREYGLKAEEV